MGLFLLLVGLTLVIIWSNRVLGKGPANALPIPMHRADEYLLAIAALLSGWSLPFIFRGKARRVLTIILAIETPFVIWFAWSLGRGHLI